MPGGKNNIKPSDGKQFSKDYQPENRRKKSLVTMIKKQLFDENEYLSIKGADELDEQGQPTGRKVNVRVSLTKAEHLVLHYLKRAKKSDIILKDAIDRIDGKAVQKNEVTGENGGPIPVTTVKFILDK